MFPSRWGLMMISFGKLLTRLMTQLVSWVHHRKARMRRWKNPWMNHPRLALPFLRKKRAKIPSQNLRRRKKKLRRCLRWKKPMARRSTRCPRHVRATAKTRLHSSLFAWVLGELSTYYQMTWRLWGFPTLGYTPMGVRLMGFGPVVYDIDYVFIWSIR